MSIVKGIEFRLPFRSEVIREATQAKPESPRPFDQQDWALAESKAC